MNQYTTSRRSGATPTTRYVKRLIKDAIADGSSLRLIEMERKGYVTYNNNGTYTLTDEGKKFLAGRQQ
jgi:predicted transcriptional regulator